MRLVEMFDTIPSAAASNLHAVLCAGVDITPGQAEAAISLIYLVFNHSVYL